MKKSKWKCECSVLDPADSKSIDELVRNIESRHSHILLHNDGICTRCGNPDRSKNCNCDNLHDHVMALKLNLDYYRDVTELFEPFAQNISNADDMKSLVRNLVNMWFLKNRNLFDMLDCMEICVQTYEYVHIFDRMFVPYELFIEAMTTKFAVRYMAITLRELGVDESELQFNLL